MSTVEQKEQAEKWSGGEEDFEVLNEKEGTETDRVRSER